ncbi:MAG TPA: zinc ribbon domain-containing protein [Bryobacteraceae bacterium]|nr:zinc ribbon domain-containing protein [Bryobacteraceae bacterium]
MFTWICPQCGREVPPSSNDCPDCAEKAKTRPAGGAPFPAAVVSAPASGGVTAPTAPQHRRAGPPPWLLALVFAIVFLTMGALGFLAYRVFSHRGEPLLSGPVNPVRTPQSPGAESATPSANVLNKYIEVTGLRLLEDKPGKLEVEFVIVNHSQAPLIEVAGDVAIRPTTAAQDGEAIGAFSFRLPELRPHEARSMRAPLQSKLRVYELPDWQFIRADVTVTSPRPDP